MMKTALILSLLWSLCSCTTSMRMPAQSTGTGQPRHVIFLVHGIGGDPSHFGHMEDALKYHLNSQDGNRFQYEVKSFQYDTGNDKKDVYEFSRDLDQFIAKSFAFGMGANDRISFVAHSQGGLITSLWILQAFQKTDGFHSEFADHVDSFTTLATPFWGAKIAGFATPLKPLATKLLLPIKTGQKQLVDMSFGSDLIYQLRQNFMENGVFRNIRVLNIGAYVKWVKITPLALGTDVYEDDTAVILPSSQADFYYLKSTNRNYDSKTIAPLTEFKETHLGQFQVVNAIHLSPSVDAPQISRGISQVQAECLTDLNCDHPAFKNVFENIRNGSIEKTFDQSAKMTSFLLDLNIQLPDGNKVEPKDVSVEFVLPKDIDVGRRAEIMSWGGTRSENKSMVRMYWTGVVKSEAGSANKQERKILMKIGAKHYKSRTLEVPVKAMESTFIELNLEK